nr:tRNA lysidine(34) synthetase TilS [Neobacillus sp. Marseille-Q6967]
MFERKVMTLLERNSFTLDNKKIIVGVSGGPDSLALLHYLWQQQESKNISIVAAHVDHMFRGKESYEDGLFVQAFCKERSIPFEMTRINVPELIQRTKKNSQIAARMARYDFFAAVMKKYGYDYLALGHHGDDQIETILMRLTRGSSSSARAGIPFTREFARGWIFRPFLGHTKAELENYCRENFLTPRIDPSNDKDVYSRNRFRRKVLPFLKKENPQVHEHFQRFSEEIHQDEKFLQELTIKRMNTVMKIREKNKITIDINRFVEVPIPLQRRGIQLILNYLYEDKPASLSAIHIDQIFSLMQHPQPSGTLDLPNGLTIIRSYSLLSFQYGSYQAQPYSFEMTKPGVIELPNGASVKLELIEEVETALNSHYALFPADQIQLPIIVRTRRAGDRMSLKGMAGTKKLKDIFIDNKVDLQERDSWPVITDGNDSIIWLPGLKKSPLEGIHQTVKKYILLTYQQ